MTETIVRVAIAVVEHQGNYLVGTRQPHEALAGCAEFPGGKCNPQEGAADCAVRECREETGLPVVAIRKLYSCRHAYPHGTLDLEFWLCRPASAVVVDGIGGNYRWFPARALQSLRFPGANQPVIELLCAGASSKR
jgi:8-oxo-dGTP diphosphatase